MVVWVVSDRDGPGIYGVYASADLAYEAVEHSVFIPYRCRPIVLEFEVETEVTR